jgi:hypothetical protein
VLTNRSDIDLDLQVTAPGATWLTRYDAAHIAIPSVVLMNPPFSAAANVDGRVADAALRHLSSALARPANGGRLIAITASNLSPDNPTWPNSFVCLQERARVVFSAAVDGPVYGRVSDPNSRFERLTPARSR